MSDELNMCSYCLTNQTSIDVRGCKYLDDGDSVEYMICQTCCATLRHFHFNNENEKTRTFWEQVWANLELAACVE